MRRYFFSFFLGAVAALWDILFQPFSASRFSIEPLLVCVVLLLVASGRSKALVTAAVGGFILNLYSFGAVDLPFVRWIVLIFLLDLILRHVLTNRSLTVAIALVVAGRLFERASAWMVGTAAYSLGVADYALPFANEWWHIFGWDVIGVSIGFMGLVLFTKRFLALVYRQER